MRIGHGYDVHRFGEGDFITLGGVQIPHKFGLLAHSDGDVLLHALSDALLGAAALGDIGKHFPDTDPKYKDVDSIRLLEIVAKMAVDNNFEIGNVDCSVVCEQPKIAPHRDEMQKILSLAAGAPVTVKGRRAEGLGAIGRVEGIACWAVAIVTQSK